MAGPGPHPVSYIKPARPLYRFAATGLGASMWFFVSTLASSIILNRADGRVADVPGEERRPCTTGMESPLGAWRALSNQQGDDRQKLHSRCMTYFTHCTYTRGVLGKGSSDHMRFQARFRRHEKDSDTEAASISHSMTLQRDSGIHPTCRPPSYANNSAQAM